MSMGTPSRSLDLSASNGSVFDNADGTYTINTVANFNGSLTLNYNVFDGTNNTAASNTVVFVTANKAPALIGTNADIFDFTNQFDKQYWTETIEGDGRITCSTNSQAGAVSTMVLI